MTNDFNNVLADSFVRGIQDKFYHYLNSDSSLQETMVKQIQVRHYLYNDWKMVKTG